MSVVNTPWDVRVVSLATSAMTTVAYIPEWESIDFVDTVNDYGHGSITFDRDADWVSDFYTANSNKYPWEGNFGIQMYRSGTLAYTFICEEAEIQYVGTRRIVSLGGRGLAACLDWAIVLPEGYDESQADPDDPDNVLFMTRGFGSVGSQADIDAGNYDAESPQYKAYGGAAFTVLFNEANTGESQTWVNYMEGSANRVDSLGNNGAVTWPLSLSSNLNTTKDSNNVNWSTTDTYPEADVTWLFELQSGITMYDALVECCSLTANAQYNVKPNGEVHIAKLLGTDRSGTILLTVPQSTNNVNSLRNTDTRSYMYSSNGYLFEAQSDSTSLGRFGRREAFVDADQSDGQTVTELARQALDDVKDELDEFTFGYIETGTTRALVDFFVGDTVSIEYEPGKVAARQITGIGVSISQMGTTVEVIVGDVVKNAIASLQNQQNTGQDNPLLTMRPPQFAKNIPAPTITATTVLREGTSRSVKIEFKTPGWVGAQETARFAQRIGHFEAEVYSVDTSQGALNTTLVDEVKYRSVKAIDKTGLAQEMVVTGMGQKGGSYVARVRAISAKLGVPISAWATTSSFALTQSGEGGGSDPYTPGQVGGLAVFPMLNAALVKFTDFTGSTNPTLAGNRGSYEIQISNATTGSFSESGNSWTRTIGGDTSGETGSSPKVYRVPNGTGFVCTGLYSQSGGRTHYVKVRAINTDGTAGAFSSVVSVSLDIDDESQTGIIIGEDSITASAIKAGTITATQIAAGSITADRMNADQVITSAIRMPQPAGASNAGTLADGTSGNEIKFSVDKDGNMWWGNFTTYANAVSRTIASGTINDDYVWTRFAGDGSDYRIGTPNNYVKFSTNPGLYSKNLYLEGTANIRGNLVVETGQSGALKAGNTTLSETRLAFGTGPYLSIDHSLGSFFGGNSIGVKWGSSSGGSQYGYIAGGVFGFGTPMIAIGISGSCYGYHTSARAGQYAGGGASVWLESTNSYIMLDADDGVYIAANTPTSSTARLYNIGGTLYWNGSSISDGNMDIAGLTTQTPGNPVLTYIPWSYSSTGSEKKMSVYTLSQELLSTGEFLDPGNGGTIDGHLVVGSGYDLKITNGYLRGGSTLTLRHSSTSSQTNFYLTAYTNFSHRQLLPGASNSYNLGAWNYRWEDFYFDDAYYYGSGLNNVSDQSLKTDIADETKGLGFINSLRPRTYKWKEVSKKDGSGDMRAGVRTHHGFVAQEVETALASDAANDGMWINMHNPAQEEVRTEDGDIVQEASEESYLQGLRMTEFIGPIVKAIQELSARVEALEG